MLEVACLWFRILTVATSYIIVGGVEAETNELTANLILQ